MCGGRSCAGGRRPGAQAVGPPEKRRAGAPAWLAPRVSCWTRAPGTGGRRTPMTSRERPVWVRANGRALRCALVAPARVRGRRVRRSIPCTALALVRAAECLRRGTDAYVLLDGVRARKVRVPRPRASSETALRAPRCAAAPSVVCHARHEAPDAHAQLFCARHVWGMDPCDPLCTDGPDGGRRRERGAALRQFSRTQDAHMGD